MTAREFFPEGTLTLEQWDLVRALSATLSPGQALWVSGYFAGLDAGLNRAGGAAEVLPVASAGARTLTILYGTETGNAREVANNLANSAKAQGLAPEVFDMGNYKERRLKDEQDLLIVVSTYGEGDPPQPAVGFFDYVEGRKAHKMEDARFAVLALGDSTYELYCEAGKRLDKRFEELGAKRLFDRVDCDIDYEEHAAHWSEQVVARLAAEAKEAGATARPAAAGAVPAAAKAASAHDKRNPFLATVIDNIPIVGRHSTKETRHVELDLSGSGLTYEPGDALGLAATNEPQVVAALLDATGLSGDAQISVKGNTRPLAEAFERDYEITTSTPRFLEHWAKLSGSKELEALRGQDRAAERSAFLYGHHVVDIVRKFPLGEIDAETFVAGLRPLQPRLYSLASSQAIVDEEAHLTLSPVRYELHGIARSGVASAHLADRAEPGTQIPVYVQHNPHFKLPTTDVPIIMIGPGTGVAPFRAFLQEREAQGVDGRSWLFFGERNFRSDFLYQTEWQDWLKQGLLTRLDVAFSRDKAEKVYVQDRLREQAEEVYAWLEEGAHVYVCGDANHMAPDVHQALIEIIAEQGRIERESAEEYVLNLQRDQRYQRDVY